MSPTSCSLLLPTDMAPSYTAMDSNTVVATETATSVSSHKSAPAATVLTTVDDPETGTSSTGMADMPSMLTVLTKPQAKSHLFSPGPR